MKFPHGDDGRGVDIVHRFAIDDHHVWWWVGGGDGLADGGDKVMGIGEEEGAVKANDKQTGVGFAIGVMLNAAEYGRLRNFSQHGRISPFRAKKQDN